MNKLVTRHITSTIEINQKLVSIDLYDHVIDCIQSKVTADQRIDFLTIQPHKLTSTCALVSEFKNVIKDNRIELHDCLIVFEFLFQGGVLDKNRPHFHAVIRRDKNTDLSCLEEYYNFNYGDQAWDIDLVRSIEKVRSYLRKHWRLLSNDEVIFHIESKVQTTVEIEYNFGVIKHRIPKPSISRLINNLGCCITQMPVGVQLGVVISFFEFIFWDTS